MTDRPTTRKRLSDGVLRAWRRLPTGRDLPGLRSLTAPSRLRGAASPRGDRRRVILVVDRSSRLVVQRWLHLFHGEDIAIFTDGFTPAALSGAADVRRFGGVGTMERAVHALPPADIVADLRATSEAAVVALWRRLFFLVPQNGIYITRGVDPTTAWENLHAGEDGSAPRDIAELLASAAPVDGSRGYTALRKTTRHFLRATGDGAQKLLATRDPALTITAVRTLPAVEFVSRARTTSHGTSHGTAAEIALPDRFEVPALTLTHYAGALHHPGEQVLWYDHSVLPPSLTINEVAVVRRARNFGHMLALPDAHLADAPELDGDFFDLATAWAGHFGHFMTEVPAKLWAWDDIKARVPGIRGLFSVKPGRPPTYERELFDAFGIPPQDIVLVDAPVRVRSLYSATPMMRNTAEPFIHPDIEGVWDRLRDGLRRTDGPRFEKIFVTRPPGMKHRPCRNAAAVEETFRDAGFEVVLPETLPLAEQATLFADARVVAGFGGSAMFNLIFADRLEATVVLNHESYTARNEHLITTVRGGDAHFFWSPADLPQPSDRFSDAAFHSAWDFDYERNGAPLTALLRSL